MRGTVVKSVDPTEIKRWIGLSAPQYDPEVTTGIRTTENTLPRQRSEYVYLPVTLNLWITHASDVFKTGLSMIQFLVFQVGEVR